METIKQMRKKYQKTRGFTLKYSYVAYISIYLTRLLIPTGISANQVTIFMIFLGAVATFFFSLGTYFYSLIAIFSLEAVFILDAVDGEIARYRKCPTIIGEFLDVIMHSSTLAMPFIGITIGLYRHNPHLNIVILGLLASFFSLANISIQTFKHHVFFAYIIKCAKEGIQKKIQVKKIKEQIKISPFKKIFKSVNLLYDHLLIIHLITLMTIFNKLYWLLLFYGLTFPLMWLIKLTHEYKTGYEPYEYLLEPYKK